MGASFKKSLIASAAAITLSIGSSGGLGVSTAFAATLRMAWSQDATGLDPHKQPAFSSIRLLELIYEPLVRLGPDLQIAPAIAKAGSFPTAERFSHSSSTRMRNSRTASR